MSLTAVTVTGPLVGAIGGTMHAQLTATLHNPAGVLAGTPIGPRIDATISNVGAFSLPLYANNDTGTQPSGLAWKIWGEVQTATGTYQLPPDYYALTAADAPTVALGSLTPATSSTAYQTYTLRADWLGANGYAHPDGTTVTQDADGTLHASAGHSFDPATPAADVAGGTVGTAATINHADHAHPLSSAYTPAAHAARTDNPHSVTAAQVGAFAISNNLSEGTAATIRTNLSLGNSATKNTGTTAGTVAAGDHTHPGGFDPSVDEAFSHAQTITITDTGTANVVDGLTLAHANSSGTPAAGFGVGWLGRAYNAARALADQVRIAAQWNAATAGSESSDLVIQLRNAGAALATVLKILGTGGFQAQSTSGTQPNALGARAVDLQWERSAATQTASGTRAFAAGSGSTASGSDSVALGQGNTASGAGAVALGGTTLANNANAVAIGNGAESRGSNSLAMGYYPIANGSFSVAIGAFAITNGSSAVAMGLSVTATGDYSRAGGNGATAALYGQDSYGYGSVPGQRDHFGAGNTTTDATATELFLDGSSARLVLAAGRACRYRIDVVAWDVSGNQSGSWTATGRATRTSGGNIALSGNSVTADSGNPAGWDFAVSADTTNQSIKLLATGAAATTIKWMAIIVWAQAK